MITKVLLVLDLFSSPFVNETGSVILGTKVERVSDLSRMEVKFLFSFSSDVFWMTDMVFFIKL